MGGFFGGGGSDINTSEPRAAGMSFQSSVYGTAVPIIYGRGRVPGNMLWYGGFKAVPHTESQDVGGKGGGGSTMSRTTYTYTASFIFGLGEGTIGAIHGVWKGKDYFSGPDNEKQTSTPSTARNESAIVPGTPYQFAVAHAARWTGHISAVWIDANGMAYNLVNGVDFTVIAGIYTFIPSHAGHSVRIDYSYTSINTAPAIITQFDGSYPQTPWSYLTSQYPAEALGYQGVAYAAALDFDLGGSTSMPNLTFDVTGRLPFGGGIEDANPSAILFDLMTNPHYGAGVPVSVMGDWSQYSNYCVANGLFLSPVYAAQQTMSEIITALMRLTNSGIYFSEGQLKITPFGDVSTTGHGATYTPNVTPIYDLTDDDFIVSGSDTPIIITRTPVVDAYNHVQVTFRSADNQYNDAVAEAKDQVSIDTFGLRTLSPIKAHEITSATVARNVAQNILQRSQYTRNTYEFTLGWKHCLLEPTDYVTLTDLDAGLDDVPVRIVAIEEDEDGLLHVTCEDAPSGISSSALYPTQLIGGYAANYNIPAESINTPVIFEAPWILTINGHEIWLGVSGGENYGGCQVWLSSNGANYKKIGTILAPARHGFLTANLSSGSDPDTTSTCAVDLGESSGVLLSGSVADADNRATLAWVDGEFIAYSTATLTGAYTYNIGGYMRRGLYDLPIKQHAERSQFARCDDALLKYVYDPDLVGKTVYLKFPAFNEFGSGHQSLSDVAEYPFTIIGYMPTPTDFLIAAGPNGSRIFTWKCAQMPSYFAGYRLYFAMGTATDVANMALLVDGFVTSPFSFEGLAAGTYTFAVLAENTAGRQSAAAFLTATIADPTIPALWADQTFYGEGTWDDLPDTWDALGNTWDEIFPLSTTFGVWISNTIDLGSGNKWLIPLVSCAIEGSGSVTFHMITGKDSDGGTVGEWRELGWVGCRYVKIRAVLSNSSDTLRKVRCRLAAATVDLTFNDINTATDATISRIGTGHFSIGSSADTEVILGARVDAIQGAGAGASWELVSKSGSINGNPAATFKIYDSALALVDTVVDITLRCVLKVTL